VVLGRAQIAMGRERKKRVVVAEGGLGLAPSRCRRWWMAQLTFAGAGLSSSRLPAWSPTCPTRSAASNQLICSSRATTLRSRRCLAALMVGLGSPSFQHLPARQRLVLGRPTWLRWQSQEGHTLPHLHLPHLRSAVRWRSWRPTSHCHLPHLTPSQPNRPAWLDNLTHQESREGFTMEEEATTKEEAKEATTKEAAREGTNATCTTQELPPPRRRPQCRAGRQVAGCPRRRQRGSRRRPLRRRRRLAGKCSSGSNLPRCRSPARRRASSVRHGIRAGLGDGETGAGREGRKTLKSWRPVGRNGRQEEVGAGSMGSRGREMESRGSRGRTGTRRGWRSCQVGTPRSDQRPGGKSIGRLDRQCGRRERRRPRKGKMRPGRAGLSGLLTRSRQACTSAEREASSQFQTGGEAALKVVQSSQPLQRTAGRSRKQQQVRDTTTVTATVASPPCQAGRRASRPCRS